MRRGLLTLICTLFLFASVSVAEEGDEASGNSTDPLAVFNQRIMPIFKSPKPSSCVQCHLAAVDLKDYILPSHEQTFVSLRDQGLIDLAHPRQSKILHLISMGEQDLDRGARMIHSRTRQAEYDAFAAWIEACCADPALRELPAAPAAELAKPEKPDEVIRHARKDRLLDSFVRNIWSQRMRCFPCHTPHELDPSNPQHAKPIERQAELLGKFGQRINLFDVSPQATMKRWIASSRKRSKDHLPLINTETPRESLIVLKPTSKLPPKKEDGTLAEPSSSIPVSHLGGLKMHVDDASYKSFLAWIEDYAQVVGEQYDSERDLPRDNWYPTQQVIRARGLPESWEPFSKVQFFVHAWNPQTGAAEKQPIAFTQTIVTPRKMVAGALFALDSEASRERLSFEGQQAALPAGKYVIKAYLDHEGRLAEEPTTMLNDQRCDGTITVETAWPEGFRNAKIFEWSAAAADDA